MSLHSFFDNFALLADAPNGIAKLRELILQLAIEGKLIPQNHGDESASALLEKIRVGQTNSKRSRKGESALASTDVESLPFMLPPNWEWARLSDIGHEWGQKKPDLDFSYVDVAAIDNVRGIITDGVKLLKPNEAPSRARKIVKKGTVIYSTVRPYLLNIAIVEKEYSPEPIASTAFAVIHPFDGISAKYLFYYLRSRTFIDFVKLQMQGVAYPAINDEKLFAALVPLPPSEEQENIVIKVDELMQICDELEARQQARHESRVRLNNVTLAPLNKAASLAPEEFDQASLRLSDNFATVCDSAETVKKLRSTILQLAVQGKLVPQDLQDEPAPMLVGRINKEKERLIKSKKIRAAENITPLSENEMPFTLPNGWVWTRFAETVFSQEGPGIRNWQFRQAGIKLLNVKNLVNGRLILENTDKYISIEEFTQKYQHFLIEDGDLLFASSGNSWGKTAFFHDPGYKVIVNTSTIRMRFINDGANNWYLRYLMDTPLLRNQLISQLQGMQPNFGSSHLRKTLLPLPPLKEQNRIVAKVIQLMALCDELETKIRQAEADSEKLMNAAVQHVLKTISEERSQLSNSAR